MIGPKTWDRVVRIYLGFLEMAVTAQIFRGLFGSFNSIIVGFKSCICMEKGREWAVGSVPKLGTELVEFFGIFVRAVTVQNC